MKAKFAGMWIYSVALMALACAGGGGDNSETTDAEAIVTTDAGGRPDATRRQTPDAEVPTVSAESLGQACNPTRCPADYICVSVEQGAQKGFCTFKCGGQQDTKTCANGYTGPGQPACALGAEGSADSYCAVLCGEQFMLPADCPEGLTCKDLSGESGPTPDGKTEICAPATI
jgi:hypothetical protein